MPTDAVPPPEHDEHDQHDQHDQRDQQNDPIDLDEHEEDEREEMPDRFQRVIRAALLYELQQHQADALDDLLTIYGTDVTDGPAPITFDDEQLMTMGRLLADGGVAAAFFGEAKDIGPDNATLESRLSAFAHQLRDGPANTDNATKKAQASGRAAGSWMIAQMHHELGRTTEVESFLDEALQANPSLVPALELASHYASDRGDALKAISLARRAGIPEDDDWLQMLSSMVPRARADVGRNDPCFCGSGRKYKQCHLNDTTVPLDQRAEWLWEKAIDHLQDSAWQHQMVKVGNAMLGIDKSTSDSVNFAMTDAIVADLVLFIDRAWDDFIDTRGHLLPADELELAQQWATTVRTFYLVADFDPGESVQVFPLDNDDDEPITVVEHTYSEHAELDDTIWARVAPVGAELQFFGGIIPFLTKEHRAELDALFDGDEPPTSLDVAAVLHGWEEAEDQPRVYNAEGEELMFIVTTFAVDDPHAMKGALDATALKRAPHWDYDDPKPRDANQQDAVAVPGLPNAFGDRDDTSETLYGQWTEEVVVKGADWIRGTVSLYGDHLELRTNSEVRNKRLRALLEWIVPASAMIDERRTYVDPTDL